MRVEGQLTFDSVAPMVEAALAGLGIAFVSHDQVAGPIAEGRPVQVLADWCPPFSGYHLYDPSRRHRLPALAVLIEALRHR